MEGTYNIRNYELHIDKLQKTIFLPHDNSNTYIKKWNCNI